MSSTRPAVTPTTTSFPAADGIFPSTTTTTTTTTPPPPPASFGVGVGSHASPSPRTIRRDSREVGHPGSRRLHPHHQYDDFHDAFDGFDRNTRRQQTSAAYLTYPPNPPRTSSLAASKSRLNKPPRSSSLLPPARIVGDPALQPAPAFVLLDPFNDPRPAPKVPDPAKEGVDPRPDKRGHSRSSSAGGASDSLRNLNRWSASTTSSRASQLASFTRRVSVEILSGGASQSPGKKLRKRRPSTAGASPTSSAQPRTRSGSPAPTTVPPLESLPPISTGPSLEHEVLESNVLARLSPSNSPQDEHHAGGDSGGWLDEHALDQEEDDQGYLSQQADAVESSQTPRMMTHESTRPPSRQNGGGRGHSHNRSNGAKGSGDTTVSSRSRDKDRDREAGRERQSKAPSQKAMLSKALQKANTAVKLDNAQNFEGARRAYAEACAVLQQVLLRTSGEEDRRKLEAIHETYLARVMELDEQLADLEPDGKELPRRPESNDLQDEELGGEAGDPDYSRPAPSARPRQYEEESDFQPTYSQREPARNPPPASSPPPVPHQDAQRDPREATASYLTQQYSLQSAFSKGRYNGGATLRPPVDNSYMPQPLSPRRALSPARPPSPHARHESPQRPPPEIPVPRAQPTPQADAPPGHRRANSHESVSWLDPIDESERSTVSSVHSRSSSRIRRKHIRAASGATEAEFDAALDDAIEAAYDVGYEPESQDLGHPYHDARGDAYADTLRRVELARELVRESEREALELANEREKRLRLQQQLEDEEYRRQEGMGEGFYDGNDSEEEERLLEEMTKGNAIEDFAFGGPSRPPPVPRESDSSGMTNRTWHSSMGSNAPTSATTVLTPVTEDRVPPQPSGPLPALPAHAVSQMAAQPHSAGSQSSGQSVRNRRLSGQNLKELKIETTKLAPAAPATAGPAVPSHPKAGSYIVQQRQALSAGPNRILGPLSSRAGPSPVPGATADHSEDGPLPPMAFSSQEDYPRVGTPSVVRPGLRKNYSSSSLRSLKTRNLSISHNMDEPSDLSPGTPLGSQFGIGGSRLPAVPSLPPGVKDRSNSTTTGGPHLFESHFHTPASPGSPNHLTPDAPAPLEPCPNDVMLRPFWLMRCLYQTLCHPRGGYLSNRLFVPREVWRVKGVKLKNVEDKIANCDLLTAALQKLARVDTCDADAVLEEMQSLEGVLEQVQATLTRKLGSEVGVQGAGSMFKDASVIMDAAGGDAAGAMPRSASVAGKAGGFSWRRLRSKNSSANLPGLASAYGGKGGSGGASGVSSTNLHDSGTSGKDTILPSLPMTSHPTSRPTKRDVASVAFTGPNANYRASLARLFDAAQTVDQIARQVDDPGLRHADKTQVGLELCTRHAAEFFAFFICRFALSDLTILLDKFIKRGSEWVLA